MNRLAGRLLLAFALVILVGSVTTLLLAGRGATLEIRHAMGGHGMGNTGMMGPRADDRAHVMQVPTEALVGRVNRAVLLATIAASGAAFGLALFLVRTIAAPLGRVAAAARAVAAGDLNARAPTGGPRELTETATALNQMAATLAHQDALRRSMLADVTHELRTPLTVMQGQIEALVDGIFPATPEHLAPLHDQTLHLARLVEDLRTLAHADADQLALERAPTALQPLARDLLRSVEPSARQKGIRLASEIPHDLPLLDADAVRLRQVLGNLLANALRHTPAGGQIRLSARAEGEDVVLTLNDTGSGIPREDVPHVFERFYRTDRSRSRDTGGSGLGLAIARRLTDAHGGTIALESEVGRGTMVSLRWPRADRGGG